jgi:hypothetical protein
VRTVPSPSDRGSLSKVDAWDEAWTNTTSKAVQAATRNFLRITKPQNLFTHKICGSSVNRKIFLKGETGEEAIKMQRGVELKGEKSVFNTGVEQKKKTRLNC